MRLLIILAALTLSGCCKQRVDTFPPFRYHMLPGDVHDEDEDCPYEGRGLV